MSTRTRRRSLATIAAAVALTLGLTACSGNQPVGGGSGDEAPGYGGTLRIASLESDLDALDPLTGYSIDSWQILRGITRQLVTFPGSAESLGADNELIGDLAEKWDVSPDGKTYTFHLRDGIRYSGASTREIVAKDFVYAIKRFCDPNKQVAAINYFNLILSGFPQYCEQFAKVEPGDPARSKQFIDTHEISGVSAPDDKTLVLTSDTKNYDFLSILAMNFVTPLPEEVASKYIGDSVEFRKNYPSSGPYQVESYEQGKQLVLTKVKGYDAKSDPARKAYVDEIVVDFTTNTEDAVVQKIQSGEADLSLYLTAPPIATIQSYTRSKSKNLYSSDGAGARFVILNTAPYNTSANAKALRNLKVRQALTYAVNRANLVQGQGGKIVAKPLHQILISTILGHQDIDPYPTDGDKGDPAKAKQLLTEAGYPNGLTLSAIYRGVASEEAKATTLKADLAKAGITLKLIKVPAADFRGYYAKKDAVWDLNLSGAFSPDWQGDSTRMLLGGWLNSDGSPQGVGNVQAVAYDNPELNKLAAEAFGSDEPGPLWSKADELVSEDLPWIPLFELRKVVVTSERLRHFTWSNVPVNPDITNVAVQ